mgnify:CR=1 FL=1
MFENGCEWVRCDFHLHTQKDKEFKYLRNDWRNPSKQNNKIKVFGMRI